MEPMLFLCNKVIIKDGQTASIDSIVGKTLFTNTIILSTQSIALFA